MDEKELKETLDKLNEHLMDEMARASAQRDFARVGEVQSGFIAMSNLERVLGVKG